MAQVAIVEMIYVAKSGRQYRAKHVEAKVGFELDDLASKAKSELSLRDYAIQFTNVNGHQQVLMPADLETIIVNVVAVTEERWEEPAYDELQKRWEQPYGDPKPKATGGIVKRAPDPERVQATCSSLWAVRPRFKQMASPADIPDGEVTQSIKIAGMWGAKPTPPRQRVQWGESASEKTQPMTVLKEAEIRLGMPMDKAIKIVEAVAAGGAVSHGSE